MTKSVEVKLSQDDLAVFRDPDEKAREDHVGTLFQSLSDANTSDLLSDFCTGHRETYDGEPTVAEVSFDGDSYGTIDVDYTGSAFLGCKDMDSIENHEVRVLFTISIATATIQFRTNPPDPPERPPNEEL